MDDDNDDKDDTKRKSRNLSEKKRRDQFNMLVNELGNMVSTNTRKLDKSTVLKSTILFLKHHNAISVKSKVHEIKEDWKPSFLSNEEFTRLILEALDGFIIIFSSSGKIYYVSESVTSLLGYLPSELAHSTIYEIAYEDDQSLLYNVLLNPLNNCGKKNQGSLKDENRTSFICHIKRGNLDISKEVTYEYVKFVGYFRKNTDIESFLPNKNYRNVLNDSKIIFIGTGRLYRPQLIQDMSLINNDNSEFTSRHSLEWKFLFLDHRASPIIGYLPFEVLGTSGYDYYHIDDLDKVVTCHELLMLKGEGTSCHYRFLTKGQQWIWLQTRFYIDYNQWNSKPEFIVCTHSVVSYSDILKDLNRKKSKNNFIFNFNEENVDLYQSSHQNQPQLQKQPQQKLQLHTQQKIQRIQETKGVEEFEEEEEEEESEDKDEDAGENEEEQKEQKEEQEEQGEQEQQEEDKEQVEREQELEGQEENEEQDAQEKQEQEDQEKKEVEEQEQKQEKVQEQKAGEEVHVEEGAKKEEQEQNNQQQQLQHQEPLQEKQKRKQQEYQELKPGEKKGGEEQQQKCQQDEEQQYQQYEHLKQQLQPNQPQEQLQKEEQRLQYVNSTTYHSPMWSQSSWKPNKSTPLKGKSNYYCDNRSDKSVVHGSQSSVQFTSLSKNSKVQILSETSGKSTIRQSEIKLINQPKKENNEVLTLNYDKTQSPQITNESILPVEFLKSAIPIGLPNRIILNQHNILMKASQNQIQNELQRKHEELQKLIVCQQEELRRVSEQLLVARYGILTPLINNDTNLSYNDIDGIETINKNPSASVSSNSKLSQLQNNQFHNLNSTSSTAVSLPNDISVESFSRSTSILPFISSNEEISFINLQTSQSQQESIQMNRRQNPISLPSQTIKICQQPDSFFK